VDMHATDLVGINGITRVSSVSLAGNCIVFSSLSLRRSEAYEITILFVRSRF
jgi:hypothetical protein